MISQFFLDDDWALDICTSILSTSEGQLLQRLAHKSAIEHSKSGGSNHCSGCLSDRCIFRLIVLSMLTRSMEMVLTRSMRMLLHVLVAFWVLFPEFCFAH
jgi:hypothetical protein